MNQKIKNTLEILRNKGLIYTINFIYYYFKIRQTRKKYSYKYIKGNGIEIGGLINPTPTIEANVKYVDYLSEEDLVKNYTEIKNQNLQKIDYICLADNLDIIEDNSQDFVIGNHLFEHLNNPIKALLEWVRVLKTGGIIFMAVPDKRRTFDEPRERTSLDHIILDYNKPSQDRDWEHYLEFASLGNEKKSEIESQAKKLKEMNYSIHYHVYQEEDIIKLVEWFNSNFDNKLEIVDIKHTGKNLADNEFIIILKVIKNA